MPTAPVSDRLAKPVRASGFEGYARVAFGEARFAGGKMM
jgi:hypothetical protein